MLHARPKSLLPGFILALLFLGVVLIFRGPSILQHRAWSGGKATTEGRIDRSAASRVKYRDTYTIGYSYEVGSQRYSGEFISNKGMGGLGPVTVTYAKSNPAVSTLRPEDVESIYRVSVIGVAVALIPLLVLVVVWLRRRFGANVGG